MKLRLLEPHQGLKAGAEWNCPWASLGRKLIEAGKALALEPADRHLNPGGAKPAAAAESGAEGEKPKPAPKTSSPKKPKPAPKTSSPKK